MVAGFRIFVGVLYVYLRISVSVTSFSFTRPLTVQFAQPATER